MTVKNHDYASSDITDIRTSALPRDIGVDKTDDPPTIERLIGRVAALSDAVRAAPSLNTSSKLLTGFATLK
jgi:hypothetical protein